MDTDTSNKNPYQIHVSLNQNKLISIDNGPFEVAFKISLN